MENAIQRRDIKTGTIMAPPRTVLVANWRGTNKTVRMNVADYRAGDGDVIANSESQFFEREVAEYLDEVYRRTHA
jgi:hypothetical protein